VATLVLSSLKDLIKHKAMKGPISFSYAILSEKSGIGKFSGSFFSIQAFHYPSFLVMESGKSLNTAEASLAGPKLCLDKAKIFSHYLSDKN
jgi:hypothetical protein